MDVLVWLDRVLSEDFFFISFAVLMMIIACLPSPNSKQP